MANKFDAQIKIWTGYTHYLLAVDGEFDPSPIPDWPTDPDSPNIFMGAWETIKGVLEQAMSKTTPSSPMAAAIAGLINNGDACVAELEQTFG